MMQHDQIIIQWVDIKHKNIIVLDHIGHKYVDVDMVQHVYYLETR